MIFLQFANYLQKLEQIVSRLEMTALLADLFSNLEPKEIPVACYLMQGKLVPTYKSLEFHMSEKLTLRALAKVLTSNLPTDMTDSTNLFGEVDSQQVNFLENIYKRLGDLGLVIEELASQQEKVDSSLSILEVHQQLVRIAQDEGLGSQDRKIESTAKLLSKLDPISMKFVTRIILGKVRLGFSIMTMIDALSWVHHGNKSLSTKIEEAYQKKADIGVLAQGFLSASTHQQQQQFLDSYQLEVGIPVLPALCQRLNSAQEIIEKMGEVIAEPKFDGLRAQIHIDHSNEEFPVQIFSRSLENITHMFPEVKELLTRVKVENCILDSEAIGYDPSTNQLLPFQQTITRKRKHDIGAQSISIPIRFYLFDLLFLNGQSLVKSPLQERKKLMNGVVTSNQSVCITEFFKTSDPAKLQEFHHQQLALGLEGAVIKKIDSNYSAGRKGWHWVKIKEAEGERGKLSDSLDCVVMGYYLGKGKRVGFGIGAFLVGVLADDGMIKTVAKIGTGLTDEQFAKLKNMSDKFSANDKPQSYDVPKELSPEVWVLPEIVVEIAADELTTSPLHTAGKALRFPRLVRFREDKTWNQATTLAELEDIVVG